MSKFPVLQYQNLEQSCVRSCKDKTVSSSDSSNTALPDMVALNVVDEDDGAYNTSSEAH